jgi:hypothetical protein
MNPAMDHRATKAETYRVEETDSGCRRFGSSCIIARREFSTLHRKNSECQSAMAPSEKKTAIAGGRKYDKELLANSPAGTIEASTRTTSFILA